MHVPPSGTRRVADYGSWSSPITAELLVRGNRSLGGVGRDGDDVHWLEGRPWESGRTVLVRNGEDVTPPPFNVRTRVHEYGGGAHLVRGGHAWFCNFADQRLYHAAPGGGIEPVTPELPLRYADMILDESRSRIICVREDHRKSDRDAVNTIVAIALDKNGNGVRSDAAGDGDDGRDGDGDGGRDGDGDDGRDGDGDDGVPGQRVLVSGHDFFSSPRLSRDGTLLAWLSWDHPNMPWDGTRLWVAEILPDGSLGEPALVAGGDAESVFQPEWSPTGELHFISDRTGWWNHYRAEVAAGGVGGAGASAGGRPAVGEAQPLHPMEAEFGVPQWVFGLSTYAFLGDGRIVCSRRENGSDRLGILAPPEGDLGLWTLTDLEIPCSVITDVRAGGGRVHFVGSSPERPAAVYELTLEGEHGERAAWRELRRSSDAAVSERYISVPRPITFPTTDGAVAHALYYPPRNDDFEAPPGTLPPLLVLSHGGPTSATAPDHDLRIQYWTSRGFALVDVNYRGSTGYGRAYRDALRGLWGIVDVDDCCAAAQHLVREGEVDPARLAIRGGSAGGYTTLCALAFRDVFHAGASHFGVSDAEALARDTHKFESRYLDGLIGPYPERRDLYVERSAIHHLDGFDCPVIFFQGLEDRVVPPDQAERMAEALRKKGVPVAYVAFPGEGHGFREAGHIRRALEAELWFYGRVFGFEPADPVEPVEMR